MFHTNDGTIMLGFRDTDDNALMKILNN